MTTDSKRGEQQAGRPPSSRPLISLDEVVGSTTAELISRVAGDLIGDLISGGGASPPGRGARSQPGQAAASMAQLLERFERCDKELAKLQQQADVRAERLRREAGGEEGAYLGKVAALEAEWAGMRSGFGQLEGRLTGVTQSATKIGNRLQNADLYRRRALEAVDQITCLQEFAHARDPSDLPPMFHDDARLGEAAAMTGKLLGVAQGLIRSKERVGLGEPKPRASAAPALGSIEAAVEQLELYRNVLDNRVVSRFDAALSRQDMPAMADCARIMAEFSRGESILVQRYISTRPMFTNLRELQYAAQQQQQQAAAAAAAAGEAGGGSGGAEAAEAAADAAALRGLSSLYKSILGTMRDEAVVIEQVFPSPVRALSAYIQRVFEQKVQTAVDAALRPPAAGAGHAQLRARLRLMAEVYRRTRSLADDLQELCGGEEGAASAGVAPVRELADSVCADALEAYLPMELRWLSGLYEQKSGAARAQGAVGLCMESVLDMLAMNEEAASRCVLLTPPAQLAPALRQLFHASTRRQANTGCLLEQVAVHLVLGLGLVVDT